MNPPLTAPSHWCVVDFIADVHLQPASQANFNAWQHYMASTQADALFILGDLFEAWVGDDAAEITTGPQAGFEAGCQQVLSQAAHRLDLYFMHGNRDFLLGSAFAQTCGMTLLADPTVLVFAAQRWLLSHGDALCLEDTGYQKFRAEVRSAAWRSSFLARPLAARRALARGLREQSTSHKTRGAAPADVDQQETLDWLRAARAEVLIHGHTHQPADHLLDASQSPPLRRLVLSDWDALASPPRLQVLRLHAGSAPQRITLPSGL